MKPKKKIDDDCIIGSHFTIEFCNGAQDSFNVAISRIAPVVKRQKYKAIMYNLLNNLSNAKRLSQGTNVKEGALPDKSNFRALKKIPIRCYFWCSKRHKGRIFVSHFIYKDFDKLDKKDTQKVVKNWRENEE